MRGTEIRQQLRNQTLQDLLTTTIKTVGDRIFPDDMAVLDLEALNQIVNSWRSTHAASYAQVLPNSGAIAEGIEDGQGISAGDNQVIEILGISLANAGGVPIDISIQLGDLILLAGVVPPTGTSASELSSILPMTLTKGVDLKFVVTGGTGSDFTAKVAYAFRVS